MKELVLLVVGVLIAIAMMGGGGINTDVSPSLNFQPKVGYMPDNRVISVDTLQHIDTNIEHQTIIINPENESAPINTGQVQGVTILDTSGQLCTPLPGETIYEGPDAKGACFVEDPEGNRFFLNAAGSRWPLIDQPIDGGVLTVEQLEKAYLDAGGTLPWSWDSKSDDIKREWLLQKLDGE